jgi:hypothetical protein
MFLLLAAVPVCLSPMRLASGPDLIWWTAGSLEKIRPFDNEPENAGREARLYAARNEFEAFQVVLRVRDTDVDGVDVEVTDLHGSAATIPNKYISVYLEGYIDLKIPSSVAGGAGQWPDPLIPRVDRYANEKRNAFPIRLVKGRNQPVWIEVFVPRSAPAGAYRGNVRVSLNGKPEQSIPLILEVWNFELPVTSSLATAFGFSGNTALGAHYGRYTGDKDLDDIIFAYQKAALWHRITLDTSAGIVPSAVIAGREVRIRWDHYDRVMAPFLDGHVFSRDEPLYGARATSVALHTPQALKTAEQQIDFWRQTARHFREKRWFDRLFHYLWDEPKPKEYPAMLELGRRVHRADPALQNLVTAPLHPEWSDVVDIWTPVVNCFEKKPEHSEYCDPTVDRSAYEPLLAKGKRLWWYQACSSHGCYIVGGDYFRGWPSYMIDDAPVRNRIMEWLTWKYDIGGELYFSTNAAFGKNRDPWKDVRLFGGNGDGTLFYPGRPDIIGGTTQIPIESIRLKLIRDGLEDYEYLVMLARLAGGKMTADITGTFIRNTYDYEQNPEKLYAARERIGREISKRM